MEKKMKRLGIILASAALYAFGSATGAMAATLTAHVDISSQTMTVRQEGKVLYTWKVSTAGEGYYTPTGSWRPKRMHRMWYSIKYDNAPMPYAIFFNGGYAIHGTNHVKRLGRPASHGCVRLHPRNAAALYALVRQAGRNNTRISIAH
jgi:lipoprotein-anchoring transpeptidase ErfK/SrfK